MGSGADGAPVRRETDPQIRLVVRLTVLLAVFALWRVRQGVDHGDGAHVVALAVRLAQGAVPFVDEMNVQVLGSFAAVPFTWVWLQVAGLEGIVLASRVWYLVLTFAAGAVGYRALRTGLRPLPAFAAVALAGTPTAYNLLVTSYNTMPGLALGLATFGGYAALVRPSGRWAALCGLALAVSVLSHPSSLPGAVVLALLVVVLGLRQPGVVRGLLLGGGGLSAVVVLWVVLGPGVGAVLETLSYTAQYQSSRPHPLDRLESTVTRHAEVFFSLSFLPTLLLALVAGVPPLPARLRAAALVLVPVAATVPAVLADPMRSSVGATSGTYAVLVAAALLGPVTVWAVRTTRRDLVLLLALSVPSAVVGLVVYSLATSATAHWGAVVPPAAPLYGVLGAGVVLAVAQAWPGRNGSSSVAAPLAAVVLLLLPLLGVHTLHGFRDPNPWVADVPVTEGPNAGLFTYPQRAVRDCEQRLGVEAWVAPGESLLSYALPAVYLYSDGPWTTNIVWLAEFGEANRTTVDWLDSRDAWPDAVAVLDLVGVGRAGTSADDPLLQRLEEDYGPPVDIGPFTVLRRDGSVTPPGGPPDLASCAIPGPPPTEHPGW